jgi:ribonuclease BN (tRNA processing enzyme)
MISSESKIVLLGTGTPNADPARSGPAVAFVVDGGPYLVDAGPGVVRRAAAAHLDGIAGLAVDRLNRVFLTHLHSDHTVGLPDLLLTTWTMGRREPLEVYGPSGTAAMIDHILAAYAEDVRERLTGPEPAVEAGWRVEVKEIEAGIVYEDRRVRVEAFPVDHGSWPTFGYRFESLDRTVVISGDTASPERNVAAYAGSDVLIHEVQSSRGLARRSPAWHRYHSAYHTSAHELAAVASEVKPGLLVLYHQLFHGVSEQELLDEVRRGYDGPIVSGRDLDVY